MHALAFGLPVHGQTGLFLLGFFGLFALAMSFVARRYLPISEVVAFLGIGLVLGPRALGVIDRQTMDSVEPVTAVALGAMVFVTGDRLHLRQLARMGRTLLPISVLGSLLTFAVCLAVLLAVGVGGPTAYLLAAIAPSTAPVTVQALIAERRAEGAFTDHVLAATALNTVVAALLFGFGAPFVFAEIAAHNAQREAIHAFVQLVVVSLSIGIAGGVGLLAAGRRIDRFGDRFLLVWVALMLMVGAVEALNSSVVIATLTAGAIVANGGRRGADEIFDAVRVLEAPVFLVFFIVTGADVHVHQFVALGGIGTAYVLARAVGRTGGSWLGLLASPARRWGWGHRIGVAQLPYAGMAVGLASYTVGRAATAGAPDVGTEVAALVLGSVFVFEVTTPLLLDRALVFVGEAAGSEESCTPSHRFSWSLRSRSSSPAPRR